MQWPAVGILTSWSQLTNHSDPSKSSELFLKWTGSRAREGNSKSHALIMLYYRWYPVVSHFNNPPQLDVLVPSARQCLVTGPGWEPCWGLTTSTLMESTMRDTNPIFIVSHPSLVFSPSLSQMAPPWVLRLPRAGVRARHGREGSHLDLLPCKEDLSLNIKALLYQLQSPEGHHLSAFFFSWSKDRDFLPLVCAVACFPVIHASVKCIPKVDTIILK